MSNYTQLKTDVQSWLVNDEVAAVVSSLVTLAEARIRRELRHWKMLKRSQTVGDNSRFLALPPDFLAPKRIKLVTSPETKPLTFRAPDQLDVANASERAWNVTLHEELEFDYEVADTTTVEILYYAALDALSDANPTNWYLVNAYDLYLMASLAESAPYLRDDERVPTWNERYKLALDGLNKEENTRTSGGSRFISFPTDTETP